jgi:hypothetical protein
VETRFIKEKWALLYDSGGSRYGVMTTNLAESYNMIIRGIRILPLVGIVEFIMYGCTNYFIKRRSAAQLTLLNPALVYGQKTSEYLQQKISKSTRHNIRATGTMDIRSEVFCKDQQRRGVRRERVVQECLFRDNGTVAYSC